MKAKRKLGAALLVVATLSSPLSTAQAQGTAFTYQGRLNDGASPANGSYDLTFAAYDALADGNLIGAVVTNSAVAVSNGLFTTSVDLGGVFTGSDLWLEIAVSTNAADAFSLIAPRQMFTPTPYALYARTAGTAAGAAPGALVTSLNTLKDDITLAAGTNVVITPNGNTLTISSAGAGGNGIWGVNGNNTYFTGGRVGIGTNSPKGALHVASGGVAVTGASSPYTGAGAGVFMESSVYGGFLFAYDYSALLPRSLLLNSPGGNVGIGSLNPQAKLHVYDPAGSVSQIIETGGGVNAWARVAVKNLNGQWDIGTSRSFNGDQLYFYREGAAANAFAVQPNGDGSFLGKLGVGTGSPSANLDVRGSGITESTVWSTAERAVLSLHSTLGSDRVWTLESGLFGTPGLFGIFDRTAGQARMTVDTSGYTVFGGPNVSVCTLTIRGGCDLAEPFATTEPEIVKGSVVVIDPDHPGQLMLSSTAYDTRVAGVVSGANGINPGIALHQEGVLEGGQNVALSGRVYVLADATQETIRPGDLLTTSATPGHAMKATDHARAQGAILGKAMTGLSGGKGPLLVLVTLQ